MPRENHPLVGILELLSIQLMVSRLTLRYRIMEGLSVTRSVPTVGVPNCLRYPEDAYFFGDEGQWLDCVAVEPKLKANAA